MIAQRTTQRDTQRSRVYAWEQQAFRRAYNTSFTPEMAQLLIRRVHLDVLAAGGFAESAPRISFGKRNGAACAKWGKLSFTKRTLTLGVILHECAHSLTWDPTALSNAAFKAENRIPVPAGGLRQYEHSLKRLDFAGHGPRYVAAFIALMERYAGESAAHALTLARGFRITRTHFRRAHATAEGVPSPTVFQRVLEVKSTHVEVDSSALNYWRNLLHGGTPLQLELAEAEVAPAPTPTPTSPKIKTTNPSGVHRLDLSAVITHVQRPNPLRAGSAAAARYELYRVGDTLAAALAAGVWRADFRWCLKKGYVKCGV